MKSIAIVLLFASHVACLPSRASDFVKRDGAPSPTTEVQDGQTGTLIVLPPQATETGLKQIPGAARAVMLGVAYHVTK